MKIFKMALEGTFQKINHVTSHRVVDIMMLLQLLNEPIYEDLQDGYFLVTCPTRLIISASYQRTERRGTAMY